MGSVSRLSLTMLDDEKQLQLTCRIFALFMVVPFVLQSPAGIGLYFRQLLSLAVLCTVYGLITSPTLAYYASSKYDPARNSGIWFAGEFALAGMPEVTSLPHQMVLVRWNC